MRGHAWNLQQAACFADLEALWRKCGIKHQNSRDEFIWEKLSEQCRDIVRVKATDGEFTCMCELYCAGSVCSHIYGVRECIFQEVVRDGDLAIASGGR
eukprot:4272763-Pyramimonas_sp.AAC.1